MIDRAVTRTIDKRRELLVFIAIGTKSDFEMIVPASDLDYKQRGDKSIGIRRRIDPRHSALGFNRDSHKRNHRRRYFRFAG